VTRSVDGGVTAVLYGKTDCHLCDEAEAILSAVSREIGVRWRKVDIESEPALVERFRYRIPVVEIVGGPTLDWPTTEGQVRRALQVAARA
jgi:hypothetical protein